MKIKIQLRTLFLILVIISTAIVRVFNTAGHTPFNNLTPIGSMALFGGKYFSSKWLSYLFPLLTIWLSDLLLNYLVYYHEWRWFYDGFYWTYGSFALIVLLGSTIRKVTVFNLVLACIGATLIHWIVSNFGVWMSGRLYPDTLEGLLACYIVAIPYELYTFLGNLIFSALTFGVFEWMMQKYPSLKSSSASVQNA